MNIVHFVWEIPSKKLARHVDFQPENESSNTISVCFMFMSNVNVHAY